MSAQRGNVIQSIQSSTLSGDGSIDTHKQELVAVASYNWLDRSNPTIVVPGSPALWTPKPPGTRLNPDAGLVYIDQNAFRNPDCPLEPLFRAVYANDPLFNASEIDLVTDRNNLRKLLQFVTGTPNDFRIEVERINGTTLFTRCEEKSSDFIRTGEFRGFGHQFEENYTKQPASTEGSTGHHRIIRYKFGGLKCLVRLVSGLALQEAATSAIHTIKRGNMASQESLAEIKTRAAHRQLDMSDVLPQLWFSHTPWLIVGYHKGGRFNDVNKLEMDRELESWERRNVRSLEKLAQLLKIIVDAAKDASGGKCSVVCQGTRLNILKSSAEKYKLPSDLREKLEASTAEE
ncbi:geranylgeranyl pyrophosphate synthetase [Sphaerosporella brunnea]|uniref:Geranylgeranyl pyrophosphate synthetase n=1 Tax=Sphaerosporella brunnea TaxID=1250544 RepID=A0A5J5F4I1_9PEZI|nr:geranylgeranyl pyrophosphate synthetase [Sphaerosporella brunnea]